ncbi:MAG: hypothetical protein SXQ77_01705, partial [Halobacteria archaeon]|nr:hypothetical protein [Halobacteria archaeon]
MMKKSTTTPGAYVVIIVTIAIVFVSGCLSAGVSPAPVEEGNQEVNQSPSNQSSSRLTVTITEVTDGDTYDIRFKNGTEDTI